MKNVLKLCLFVFAVSGCICGEDDPGCINGCQQEGKTLDECVALCYGSSTVEQSDAEAQDVMFEGDAGFYDAGAEDGLYGPSECQRACYYRCETDRRCLTACLSGC